MEKIRIALVDDHLILRQSLSHLLASSGDYEIIHESSDGTEFLKYLKKECPDVVLMDIIMPVMDGIKTTEIALNKRPELKIIVMSMIGNRHNLIRMMQLGARGFISKASTIEELKRAIHQVATGGTYYSQKLLQDVVESLSEQAHRAKVEHPVVLTRRESEVLDLLCSGVTTPRIAEHLSISCRTVEGHRARLIRKMGVENTVQLVLHAFRSHLTEVKLSDIPPPGRIPSGNPT